MIILLLLLYSCYQEEEEVGARWGHWISHTQVYGL